MPPSPKPEEDGNSHFVGHEGSRDDLAGDDKVEDPCKTAEASPKSLAPGEELDDEDTLRVKSRHEIEIYGNIPECDKPGAFALRGRPRANRVEREQEAAAGLLATRRLIWDRGSRRSPTS